MARITPALKRVLDELDAEARAELDRQHQKLPAWIGLYRYPNNIGGERTSIVWRSRERVPRGEAVPTIEGHKPQFVTIVDEAGQLDLTARSLMRLWMAERQLAVQRKDRDAERAAKGLWRWLLAHPPSLDRRAANLRHKNAERAANAAAEQQQWRDEDDRIRAHNPKLKRWRRATLIKENLKSDKSRKTIWRQIPSKK